MAANRCCIWSDICEFRARNIRPAVSPLASGFRTRAARCQPVRPIPIFALCSPFVKYDSHIAVAPGNVFTVKEFEQRDRVFSGNSGPGFEVRDRELGAGSSFQNASQRLDRRSVEDQFLIYLKQLTITQQD